MMNSRRWPNLAVNPLQVFATADGWFDFTAGPALDERLALVADTGFTAVHADVPPDMSTPDFLEALGRHGLRPAPGYVAVPSLADPGQRQMFVERCAAAARSQHDMGLSVVFVGPDLDPSHPRFRHPAVGYDHDEQRLDETTEAIRLTAEIIQREGVRPALHPHVGTWIETESEILYVLQNIPASVLSLGPDTGHLAWAGMRPEHFVREHAERIVALHIKDVRLSVARRSVDSDLDYRQTVAAGIWAEPGAGDLDLGSALDGLPDRSMWLVIEVDRPSDGDVVSSLATSANWAQALGDGLTGPRSRPR